MFGCFRFHVQSLHKYAETVLRLVILVVAVNVGPGCERLVQFVVLVIEFSRAWGVSCCFIVDFDLFVLVAKVIADVKVLWKSLMFLIILLGLVLLVTFSITCVVFFVILLICVVICFTMAIIRMITMTSLCRSGVMFGLFSFCTPYVNCVSAMSHARSGILLFGTTFLPSLVFPVCSSSYSLQTFSAMGIFLTSLWCTLVT